MKNIKNKKTELITWLIFAISSLLLYFVATDYAVFPSRYKYPLLLGIFVFVCTTGILAVVSKGFLRTVSIVLNVLLTVLMVAGLILLPTVEKRIRNIFKDVRTDEAIINVYVMKDKYKEDINEFVHSTFITQKRNDQENQKYAIEVLEEELGVSAIKTQNKDDIVSAVEALYNSEGDLLILNEAYVDMIEEIEKFSNFSKETRIVYTIRKEIEIVKEEPIERDITNSLFTVYVAGEDTRSGRLSIYGRTDVDIVVNINPVTRQIMIVGIPRDTYIPNPAIDYGYDKLTHLGNDGIQNTMKGVSEYYGIDIDYYGVVNFNTFQKVIDALGGIDVENPYYFTTLHGNGSLTGKVYDFPEGNIHLDGENALAYCRERYNLSNGDYGRSEHQTIVLKAILEKLMSPDSISHYDDLLIAMQGQVLTNIEVDNLYKLVAMQLNDNSDWDIISYHMGGTGDMQGTASMGWDRKLYVVHPFESQVKFIRQETEKMKNNKVITQQNLPNEDDTTFIPN